MGVGAAPSGTKQGPQGPDQSQGCPSMGAALMLSPGVIGTKAAQPFPEENQEVAPARPSLWKSPLLLQAREKAAPALPQTALPHAPNQPAEMGPGGREGAGMQRLEGWELEAQGPWGGGGRICHH